MFVFKDKLFLKNSASVRNAPRVIYIFSLIEISILIKGTLHLPNYVVDYHLHHQRYIRRSSDCQSVSGIMGFDGFEVT